MTVKLDIGSGPFPRGGDWTPVDCCLDAPGVVKAFMWDLPYADGTVDAIYSSHSLEHVTKYEVPRTLSEWHRVLRQGGTAEVCVPDLRWVCRNWLEHQTNDWHLDTIFGLATHEGELHRTGFTPALLRSYLEQAGFQVVEDTIIWSHEQDTIRQVAVKP